MEEIIPGIDYKSFFNIVRSIPSCIFFKDTDLKYIFSTHIWEQLTTSDIIGKTDLEVRRDKENAILAMKTDQNIIKTKKGCNYVVRSFVDGHIQYLDIKKEPVINSRDEVKGIVGLVNDITEEVILKNKVEELATKDTLTGLFNRQAGTNAIQSSIDKCKANKAFCLLDIDKFKSINDQYGHQVGDKVLKEFGNAIKKSLYDNDIAMRLGGDEFIIFLKNISTKDQIKSFLNKLCKTINNINIEELDYSVAFSIGIKFVDDDSTFDSLYASADKNMYIAKRDNDKYYILD